VNWRIVPVKPSLLLGHSRPLLLEVLQELAHGLDDEVGVNGGTLGNKVYVDEALSVQKHHDYLFGPVGVHSGLYGACLALGGPLLALFFHLQSVI
jgi:hypothetical protein